MNTRLALTIFSIIWIITLIAQGALSFVYSRHFEAALNSFVNKNIALQSDLMADSVRDLLLLGDTYGSYRQLSQYKTSNFIAGFEIKVKGAPVERFSYLPENSLDTVPISSKIKFDSNGSDWGEITFFFPTLSSQFSLLGLRNILIGALAWQVFCFFAFSSLLLISLYQGGKALSLVLASHDNRIEEHPRSRLQLILWRPILATLQLSNQRYRAALQEIEKRRRAEVIEKVARQVAHDIRAPLATLDVVLKTANQLPDEQRMLVKNASTRIREIANDLLQRKGQKTEGDSKLSAPLPLSPVLSRAFEEKAVLVQGKPNLQLVLCLDSPMACANISEMELERALSNLINNAIEATDRGEIKIRLLNEDGAVRVQVEDNGKGIPERLLSRLCEPGASFGKFGSESGSGLGLFHARLFAEAAGGRINIESRLGKGTTVSLEVPCSDTPWLFRELSTFGKSVVVIDDDFTIFEMWRSRLVNLGHSQSRLLHFSEPAALMEWMEHSKERSDLVFLIDQHFAGSSTLGSQLIQELQLEDYSVIVSSSSNDPVLISEALRVGVKVLPKELIPFIPIRTQAPVVVLLDDDSSIRELWSFAAKRTGLDLRLFETAEQLFSAVGDLARDSQIYLDEHLGNGQPSGSLVAERLGKMGFREIYLCTGRNPDTVAPGTWVRKVLGKAPPWI